jgi:hypothetical protein
MAERDNNSVVGYQDPAFDAFAITPDDDNDLTQTVRGIYVGGSGDLEVDMAGGETEVVFVSVLAGTILPIEVVRVRENNTTATNLVGLV